jgi:mono/diheme cytochrome c family protein
MKYLIFLFVFVFFCTYIYGDLSNQKDITQQNKKYGEQLFKANCGNCHKSDKDFTGPALRGSLLRWGYNKKAMYAFIRNPAKSISENAYAKKHYKKWKGGGMMTGFPQLSDKDLDAIMSYCDPILK